MHSQTWNPDDYDANGRFVTRLGSAVLQLLAPKPGERILDLGCGDGILTEKISEAGATVVGADTSEAMIKAARARGVDARLVDAHNLAFNREFDAVFSNAALHWMLKPDHVLDGIARALRPGGRFVAEFGAHGNIAAIQVAQLSVCVNYGGDPRTVTGRYYPTPAEYQTKLRAHGFEVSSIQSIPRPTPLPTGMEGWLTTFAKGFLESIPEVRRAEALRETVELLRPFLRDSAGNWTADYVRLRVAAHHA